MLCVSNMVGMVGLVVVPLIAIVELLFIVSCALGRYTIPEKRSFALESITTLVELELGCHSSKVGMALPLDEFPEEGAVRVTVELLFTCR